MVPRYAAGGSLPPALLQTQGGERGLLRQRRRFGCQLGEPLHLLQKDSHCNVLAKAGGLSTVGAVNFDMMATSQFQTKDFGEGTKKIDKTQGPLALNLHIFFCAGALAVLWAPLDFLGQATLYL